MVNGVYTTPMTTGRISIEKEKENQVFDAVMAEPKKPSVGIARLKVRRDLAHRTYPEPSGTCHGRRTKISGPQRFREISPRLSKAIQGKDPPQCTHLHGLRPTSSGYIPQPQSYRVTLYLIYRVGGTNDGVMMLGDAVVTYAPVSNAAPVF